MIKSSMHFLAKDGLNERKKMFQAVSFMLHYQCTCNKADSEDGLEAYLYISITGQIESELKQTINWF